jgi:hypothetical protein
LPPQSDGFWRLAGGKWRNAGRTAICLGYWTKQERAMVSSYLICDLCGRFGPPAGFLSQDGLRLCYQCWYQERLSGNPSKDGEPEPPPPEEPGTSREPDTDTGKDG